MLSNPSLDTLIIKAVESSWHLPPYQKSQNAKLKNKM